ncbi:hypothetical protein HDA39_004960 [Kribbella italica]|uniref:Uncharacterized protein n=1 Tax=Kribbella italica TaxID=1540520 RepID=A0A7W9J9S8_9ACTN|nr:hypothetical protein [Kribbella italica]
MLAICPLGTWGSRSICPGSLTELMLTTAQLPHRVLGAAVSSHPHARRTPDAVSCEPKPGPGTGGEASRTGGRSGPPTRSAQLVPASARHHRQGPVGPGEPGTAVRSLAGAPTCRGCRQLRAAAGLGAGGEASRTGDHGRPLNRSAQSVRLPAYRQVRAGQPQGTSWFRRVPGCDRQESCPSPIAPGRRHLLAEGCLGAGGEANRTGGPTAGHLQRPADQRGA